MGEGLLTMGEGLLTMGEGLLTELNAGQETLGDQTALFCTTCRC